jgi:AbrB family looped-hinge helix DNA binding protein
VLLLYDSILIVRYLYLFLHNIKSGKMEEKQMTTTISSKGQVVIPFRLRRKLNLIKNERLIIKESHGERIMKPIVQLSKLRGIDKGLGITSASVRKMREEDLKLED